MTKLMTKQIRTVVMLGTFCLSAGMASGQELNLYTTREPGLVKTLLEPFTKTTGIKVNTIFLKDGLAERVGAEGAKSPADVLMTVDFGNLLDLTEKGLTQPVQSKALLRRRFLLGLGGAAVLIMRALLFPGQGSQYVGMGADLARRFPEVRGLYDQADSICGFSLSKVCFEGPDTELVQTSRTQPAIFVHSLAPGPPGAGRAPTSSMSPATAWASFPRCWTRRRQEFLMLDPGVR